MGEIFLPFFLVLLVAVVFAKTLSQLFVPWAVSLMVGGMIIGPYGFGWLDLHESILFLSEIGAVFVMFMAGLEINLDTFKEKFKQIGFIGFFNGFIPFIAGMLIALSFGFDWTIALLLGIVFVSSSVAVVVPTLHKNKMLGTDLGNAIIGTTIIQDLASLVLASIFFQTVQPGIADIPLALFYVLILCVIVALRWAILYAQKWLLKTGAFHQEFQMLLLILSGAVVVFAALGLHHIVAGFFAGLILSDALRGHKIKENIDTAGYGIFIPIFFVVIGAQTDMSVFGASGGQVLLLAAVVIAGLVASKLFSGYVSAKAMKYKRRDAWLIGLSSMPQLATTLAVAYTFFAAGLIPQELVSVLVMLSVVTSVATPFIVRRFLHEKS